MKTSKAISFFAILLTTLFLGSGCSSLKKGATLSKKTVAKNDPYKMKLSNYDKKTLPNDQIVIEKMIQIVQPELEAELVSAYAKDISKAVHRHNINPQIIISLIDTESNFQASKVSHTGDLSIAQVNVDVWNKEFQRLKQPLIKKGKLKHVDQGYAIDTMARILSILKNRNEKKDRRWYARYHSNTKKYKWDYLKKIEIRMNLLEKSSSLQVLAMD